MLAGNEKYTVTRNDKSSNPVIRDMSGTITDGKITTTWFFSGTEQDEGEDNDPSTLILGCDYTFDIITPEYMFECIEKTFKEFRNTNHKNFWLND